MRVRVGAGETIVVKPLGALLNVIALVAPRLGQRVAWRVFTFPPPWRPVTAEERIIKERFHRIVAAAESETLVLDDGARIALYKWMPTRTANGQRVLLNHGWSGGAQSMAGFVDPLLAEGVEVVALDMPGHGRSSGFQHTIDLGARVLLAVDRAHGPFDAVITHSHGGASFGVAVGGMPTVPDKFQVKRAVMIASPHDIAELCVRFADHIGLRPELKAYLLAESSRLAKRDVADIKIGEIIDAADLTTLIVCDDDDQVIPIAEGRAMARSIAGAEYIETKQLGHRAVVVDRAVVSAAVRVARGMDMPPA